MREAVDFANNKKEKIVYPAWITIMFAVVALCALLVIAKMAWSSDFTVNGPGQAQAQCSESQGVVTCR